MLHVYGMCNPNLGCMYTGTDDSELITLYCFHVEIGNHFKFDSDCIVDPKKSTFKVEVVRSERQLRNNRFDLRVGHICYDKFGNEV